MGRLMTGCQIFGACWAALCVVSAALFAYLIKTAPVMEADREEF